MISPLARYVNLTNNMTVGRTHAIDTVTIHCFVGNVTCERGCDYFTTTGLNASCNYVIGYDGGIGCSVDESNRSWCSSNSDNDNRAITIEVASDTYHPYTITNQAYEALLNLLVDICVRNNIKSLVWSTDKNQRVNHLNGCNMTVHRDYANKSCPGDYLYNKMGETANKVNTRLWAINNGFLSGYGNGEYGWSDSLTREQFIMILKKVVEKYELQ